MRRIDPQGLYPPFSVGMPVAVGAVAHRSWGLRDILILGLARAGGLQKVCRAAQHAREYSEAVLGRTPGLPPRVHGMLRSCNVSRHA